MSSALASTTKDGIQSLILTVRGQRVMLDSDLARLFGVALKRLNEQVRRNRERFPSDFAFQLEREEFANLKSQIATSRSHGGKRKLLEPPAPEPPRREIGFHLRETSSPYRVKPVRRCR
jgi:hypothetical protein